MKFLIVVLFIFMSLSQVNALSSEQEVLRLKKGEYYFYYLSQDFLPAMTLLVQLQAQDPGDKELDVMEATMLLSLGLYSQAQVIFEKVKAEGGSSPSQSWFYLASRWFELGQFYNAIYSLQQIEFKEIKEEFQRESQFMLASSHIELGEHEEAQRVIATMPRASIWKGYARHNYIIAMMLGSNSGRSLNLLIEDTTFYLPETDEASDLRDRINLISGIHFLERGNNDSANKYLKLVSLAGPYTPTALLQYGWTKVELGQLEEALQTWRELQTRFNRFDPDVMESMLGVPQLFELMKAYGQALRGYESIEKRLLAMKRFVGETQNKFKSAVWLDSWISAQSNSSWGEQSKLNSTIIFDNTSGLLHQVLSEDSVVNELQEYRDLVTLSRYLAAKEQNLLLWKQMLKQREANTLARNIIPQLKSANQIINESEDDYKKSSQYLKDSEQQLFAFPSPKQEDSLVRLTRSTLNLETLMESNSATRDVNGYQQRWARVKGVLLWQMNEVKPKMQWQLQSDLMKTKKYITQAKRQLLETRLADKWTQSSLQGMDRRVDEVLLKTVALKKVTKQVEVEAKGALLSKFNAFLLVQKRRINDYLAQSRLSIARLYDDALQQEIALDDVPSPAGGIK
jgi:hypothetical protein